VAEDALRDDPQSTWERVRGEVRGALPPSTFKLWIEPLRAVSIQGDALYLAAPASVRTWVERRYAGCLDAALRLTAPGLERIMLVPQAAPEDTAAAPWSAEPESLPLDPTHTFERFVIGYGNRLAHSAALAVAELPGEAYNPLFLHGPPGLGKTHLLGAIADYLRRRRPELTVHYTTAERYTTEFVGALRESGPEAFKRRYRKLDALLIDDVQALEGKERTQEEFVHTFNALHAAGKQIVLSSDRPPAALARLAERLRDRFDWGLTAELGPPDLRTRTALLWRLAAERPLAISEPGAIREIAARAAGNVRLLEGAMTRVVALSSMLSEPLSTRLVAKAFGGHSTVTHGEANRDTGPSATAIQEAVCTLLRVRREDLLSPKRTARVARARQLAMYLTREMTELSLVQIAREFGRDHSTVLHAIRNVERQLGTESEADALIHKARNLLLSPRTPQTSSSTDSAPVHR
jgi:chromosomal replication initiator protein